MNTSQWAVLAVSLMILPVRAFDPVGPPPEKTMAWTVDSLSKLVIPAVDFDGATVKEAAMFLEQTMGPKQYFAALDTSGLDPRAQHRVTTKGRGLTLIQILGRMAEEIGADLLISPGKVSFVSRRK